MFWCFIFLCETDFFRCSACAFDMCLLNYLLTYLLTYFKVKKCQRMNAILNCREGRDWGQISSCFTYCYNPTIRPGFSQPWRGVRSSATDKNILSMARWENILIRGRIIAAECYKWCKYSLWSLISQLKSYRTIRLRLTLKCMTVDDRFVLPGIPIQKSD